MKSGKMVEMNLRWSATVVEGNGEWKVAIAHVGTDFLNNPVLDGVEKPTKMVDGVHARSKALDLRQGRISKNGPHEDRFVIALRCSASAAPIPGCRGQAVRRQHPRAQ